MNLFPTILRAPDALLLQTETELHTLLADSPASWSGQGARVEIQLDDGIRLRVALESQAPVKGLQLRWRGEFPASTRFLGDAWERAYGDLEWRGIVPERAMPWSFVATNGAHSAGYGVETGAGALCFWRADGSGISLHLDVSNGSAGVQLQGRALDVAAVRFVEGDEGQSAFETARALCRALCAKPRLPRAPVYGGNDWYYAYGQNSRASILRDAEILSELAPSGENQPFMVIDDGWQGCRAPENGGPWHVSSAAFGDMNEVADAMRERGTRPGLWFRPLQTVANVPASWRFGKRGGKAHIGGLALDPSVPEVFEFVAADIKRFGEWGFELVKHDFSMMDIFGRWGNSWGENPGGKTPWHFADRTRTSAEIITAFFQTLRDAAGDEMLLMGCNTIGHLSAGVFELQRTGDDTSGHDWERTRQMGINTLAFRMAQHETFFAAAADCVGLTTQVPWELNRQWLDVLARSGTRLFVSADPKALGPAQKAALREAFARAATAQAPAQPLDWLDTTCPRHWQCGDQTRSYRWSSEPDAPVAE